MLNSLLYFLCLGAAVLTAVGVQAETLRIGGSGVALAALRQVGKNMTAKDPNLRVEVLPSLSTPGGIRAMIAGEIDVLIASRVLAAEERAKVDGESVCLITALVLATPHMVARGITTAELPGYYADAKPMWPDGTPLKIILRLSTSSESAAIAKVVLGFKAAYEAAQQRKGIPVAATDQDNADLALRTADSLSFMTLLQIESERLALKPLMLDGIAPSVETIANKTYPLDFRVCLVLMASPPPAATRLLAYVKSPEGQSLLRSFGAILSD